MKMAATGDRPDDLPGKIVVALDRLAHAQRSHRQALATQHRLTRLQVELVTTLAQGSPPAPVVGQLASELGVRQPTVTDSVRALERKSLVRRGSGELRLTPAGRRLATALVDEDAVVRDGVAAMSRSAQEHVFLSLLTVIAQLVDTGAVRAARTCLTCRYRSGGATAARCELLDRDLPTHQLRVNCPEHQPAS